MELIGFHAYLDLEDRWLKVPGSYDKIKEWMGDVEVKRKVSFKVGRKLVQLNPG